MIIPAKLKNQFCKRKYLPFVLTALIVLSIIACCIYASAVPPVMAQSSAGSLPDVVMSQSGQRILIFSPHPDDETIAVGGYIARSTAAGADVRIVLVTDGNYHHNEPVRYSEFKQATQILGVPESNLVFLGLPDGKLETLDKTTLSSALKAQIEQYDPDIVICPSIKDENPDHAAIGKTVEEILKADPHQRTVYEYLIHYKYIWPRPRELAPKIPLSPPIHLLNADSMWEKVPLSPIEENLKSEAIHVYRSQLENEWLKGLFLSSIRTNELLIVPRNLYAK
jgi:LmbE family N-acetylglucosaminyl deacetylase